MGETICAICKKKTKENLFVIRNSWVEAGGFGHIPEDARVHVSCDKKEQSDIKTGKIKLSELWTKKN